MADKPTVITHSGNFHVDDVFAVAVLDMVLGGEYTLIRTRDVEIIQTGDYVVDVGGEYDSVRNRFDHHQEGGGGVRENGIPYSSLGLVWKKYGTTLCGSPEVAGIIDKNICVSIDAGDNGVETFTPTREDIFPYGLHSINNAFRPTWKEEQYDYDVGFRAMLVCAKKILEREIAHARDEREGEVLAEEAYQRAEDKRIIILDGHYPYENVLSKHFESLYVVKPDHQNGGRWKVKTIRDDPRSFADRKPFPSSWAGKMGDNLVAVSGVSDATFCHNKLFIVGANSKEGAIALARVAADA